MDGFLEQPLSFPSVNFLATNNQPLQSKAVLNSCVALFSSRQLPFQGVQQCWQKRSTRHPPLCTLLCWFATIIFQFSYCLGGERKSVCLVGTIGVMLPPLGQASQSIPYTENIALQINVRPHPDGHLNMHGAAYSRAHIIPLHCIAFNGI